MDGEAAMKITIEYQYHYDLPMPFLAQANANGRLEFGWSPVSFEDAEATLIRLIKAKKDMPTPPPKEVEI